MKKKIIIPLLISLCMLTAAACGNDTADDSESVSGGTDATEVVIAETDTDSTEAVTTESEGTESSAVETESSSTETGTETGSTDTETSSPESEATSTEETPSNEADSESESEEIPAIEDITVTSEDDGILLLKALFGTEDDETGDSYVYIYLNTVTIDDVEYYAYTWSKDLGDHYTRLTDIFITFDGSAVYEGDYDVESSIFNTDNMLES